MVKKLLIAATFPLLFSTSAWAQQQDRREQPTRQRRGQTPQERSGRFDQSRQAPLFLTGKVTLEDGTAPPEPVRVAMICNGTVFRQMYTFINGDFDIQLEGSNQRR